LGDGDFRAAIDLRITELAADELDGWTARLVLRMIAFPAV